MTTPHAIHRTALTGSRALTATPAKAVGWQGVIWPRLDRRWQRTLPGETFVLRHGGAREGADWIGHEWVLARQEAADARHGSVLEEVVAADWEHCGPACKPIKANGEPHRLPNKGNRGTLADYCPAAGHRRNPDVPNHPDFWVEVLMGFVLDNSPGATATLKHADEWGIPSETVKDYTTRRRRT